MSQHILEVEHLVQHFRINRKEAVHAVDDVSFTISRGQTLGLVGESGCGKSSCARSIIRVYDPTGGKIVLDGEDITHMSQKELQPRRKKMQMIFQDPYASLNARMTVRDIIAEPLLAHHVVKGLGPVFPVQGLVHTVSPSLRTDISIIYEKASEIK